MSQRPRIIVADPPWDFTTYSDKAQKSAKKHYPTMSLTEIAALPLVAVIPDDALLLLWATWPNLDEAMQVGRAWGFTYKTLGFCWVKIGAKSGTPTMGLGYYTRANSEPCLLFTRGNVNRSWIRDYGVSQIILDDQRQLPLNGFFEDTVLEPALAHSTKPDAFYHRIERLVAGPYLELFGRRRRKNWVVLGNAIDNQDIRAALLNYGLQLNQHEETLP